MFDIIPLILILISFAVIIVIVLRKFSVLASLDIDNIPAEKEAVFKEQIISKRIKRNLFKHYAKVSRLFLPVKDAVLNFFKWSYQRLLDFKDTYNKEKTATIISGDSVEKLFAEVEELIKNDNSELAEKKLIEIISLDSKNIKAFRVLAKVYADRKSYNEARQTMEHALRLAEKAYNDQQLALENGLKTSVEDEGLGIKVAGIYYDIALICRNEENYNKALDSIENALKIEPNNPKYLDIKVEISIINKDKKRAFEAYEKLKNANPDNQKLGEIKESIDELE
jgi:tetratricopeptide (TPR) repeat protein